MTALTRRRESIAARVSAAPDARNSSGARARARSATWRPWAPVRSALTPPSAIWPSRHHRLFSIAITHTCQDFWHVPSGTDRAPGAGIRMRTDRETSGFSAGSRRLMRAPRTSRKRGTSAIGVSALQRPLFLARFARGSQRPQRKPPCFWLHCCARGASHETSIFLLFRQHSRAAHEMAVFLLDPRASRNALFLAGSAIASRDLVGPGGAG